MPKDFGKNLSKSFSRFMEENIAKKYMPTVYETAKNLGNTKTFIRDVISNSELSGGNGDLSDFKNSIKKYADNIKNVPGQIAKDIKSGNIFGNGTAMQKAIEGSDFEGLMDDDDEDDFSFSDDDDFDDDFDDIIGSSSDKSGNTFNTKKSFNDNRTVNKIFVDAGANFGESGAGTVKAINNSSSVNIALNQQLLNALGVMSDQVSSLVSFQRDVQSDYYAKSMEIQGNILDILNEWKEAGFGGEKKDEESVESEEKELSRFEKIFGTNEEGGLFNLKEYFTAILDNVSEGYDEYRNMYGMMINMFSGDPLGTISNLLIDKIIPSAMRDLAKEFDDAFKMLPLALNDMFGEWADGSSNFLLEKIGEFLHISDDRESNGPDFSKYEKGKVPFDGITRKAVVDVIPTLLSKILSAVNKDADELMFDYDNNRWSSVNQQTQRLAQAKQKSAENNYSDLISETKDRSRRVLGNNDVAAKQFDADLNAIVSLLDSGAIAISSNGTLSDTSALLTYGVDKESIRLFNRMLKSDKRFAYRWSHQQKLTKHYSNIDTNDRMFEQLYQRDTSVAQKGTILMTPEAKQYAMMNGRGMVDSASYGGNPPTQSEIEKIALKIARGKILTRKENVLAIQLGYIGANISKPATAFGINNQRLSVGLKDYEGGEEAAKKQRLEEIKKEIKNREKAIKEEQYSIFNKLKNRKNTAEDDKTAIKNKIANDETLRKLRLEQESLLNPTSVNNKGYDIKNSIAISGGIQNADQVIPGWSNMTVNQRKQVVNLLGGKDLIKDIKSRIASTNQFNITDARLQSGDKANAAYDKYVNDRLKFITLDDQLNNGKFADRKNNLIAEIKEFNKLNKTVNRSDENAVKDLKERRKKIREEKDLFDKETGTDYFKTRAASIASRHELEDAVKKDRKTRRANFDFRGGFNEVNAQIQEADGLVKKLKLAAVYPIKIATVSLRKLGNGLWDFMLGKDGWVKEKLSGLFEKITSNTSIFGDVGGFVSEARAKELNRERREELNVQMAMKEADDIKFLTEINEKTANSSEALKAIFEEDTEVNKSIKEKIDSYANSIAAMGRLAEMGSRPGSIYTHDVHFEDLFLSFFNYMRGIFHGKETPAMRSIAGKVKPSKGLFKARAAGTVEGTSTISTASNAATEPDDEPKINKEAEVAAANKEDENTETSEENTDVKKVENIVKAMAFKEWFNKVLQSNGLIGKGYRGLQRTLVGKKYQNQLEENSTLGDAAKIAYTNRIANPIKDKLIGSGDKKLRYRDPETGEMVEYDTNNSSIPELLLKRFDMSVMIPLKNKLIGNKEGNILEGVTKEDSLGRVFYKRYEKSILNPLKRKLFGNEDLSDEDLKKDENNFLHSLKSGFDRKILMPLKDKLIGKGDKKLEGMDRDTPLYILAWNRLKNGLDKIPVTINEEIFGGKEGEVKNFKDLRIMIWNWLKEQGNFFKDYFVKLFNEQLKPLFTDMVRPFIDEIYYQTRRLGTFLWDSVKKLWGSMTNKNGMFYKIINAVLIRPISGIYNWFKNSGLNGIIQTLLLPFKGIKGISEELRRRQAIRIKAEDDKEKNYGKGIQKYLDNMSDKDTAKAEKRRAKKAAKNVRKAGPVGSVIEDTGINITSAQDRTTDEVRVTNNKLDNITRILSNKNGDNDNAPPSVPNPFDNDNRPDEEKTDDSAPATSVKDKIKSGFNKFTNLFGKKNKAGKSAEEVKAENEAKKKSEEDEKRAAESLEVQKQTAENTGVLSNGFGGVKKFFSTFFTVMSTVLSGFGTFFKWIKSKFVALKALKAGSSAVQTAANALSNVGGNAAGELAGDVAGEVVSEGAEKVGKKVLSEGAEELAEGAGKKVVSKATGKALGNTIESTSKNVVSKATGKVLGNTVESTGKKGIGKIFSSIGSKAGKAGKVVSGAGKAVVNGGKGILSKAGSLLASVGVKAISSFLTFFITGIKDLLTSKKDGDSPLKQIGAFFAGKTGDTFGSYLKNIGTQVLKWGALGLGIGTVVPVIGNGIGALVGAIIGLIAGIFGNDPSKSLDTLKRGFNNIFNKLNGFADKALTKIVDTEKITAWFDNAIGNLKGKIEELSSNVAGFFSEAFSALFNGSFKEFIGKFADKDSIKIWFKGLNFGVKVVQIAGKIGSAIETVLVRIFSELLELPGTILTSILKGITKRLFGEDSFAYKFAQKLSGIVKTVKDIFINILSIPSKLFNSLLLPGLQKISDNLTEMSDGVSYDKEKNSETEKRNEETVENMAVYFSNQAEKIEAEKGNQLSQFLSDPTLEQWLSVQTMSADNLLNGDTMKKGGTWETNTVTGYFGDIKGEDITNEDGTLKGIEAFIDHLPTYDEVTAATLDNSTAVENNSTALDANTQALNNNSEKTESILDMFQRWFSNDKDTDISMLSDTQIDAGAMATGETFEKAVSTNILSAEKPYANVPYKKLTDDQKREQITWYDSMLDNYESSYMSQSDKNQHSSYLTARNELALDFNDIEERTYDYNANNNAVADAIANENAPVVDETDGDGESSVSEAPTSLVKSLVTNILGGLGFAFGNNGGGTSTSGSVTSGGFSSSGNPLATPFLNEDNMPIVEIHKAATVARESNGDPTTVVKNDKGQPSIGLMQWRGSDAVNVIRRIAAEDSSIKISSALEADMKNWSHSPMSSSVESEVKSILGSSNAVNVQNKLMDERAAKNLTDASKHYSNAGKDISKNPVTHVMAADLVHNFGSSGAKKKLFDPTGYPEDYNDFYNKIGAIKPNKQKRMANARDTALQYAAPYGGILTPEIAYATSMSTIIANSNGMVTPEQALGYQNGNTQIAKVSTSGGTWNPSAAGSGINGNTANGYPYFNQASNPHGNKRYGSGSTYQQGGCAPTAMAMIYSDLTGQMTDVETMGNMAIQGGFRKGGNGTNYQYFPYMAKQMGVGWEAIGNFKKGVESESVLNDANAKTRLLANLAAGNPVVARMHPPTSPGQQKWAKSGHFIVLPGMVDGKIVVNDPGSKERTRVGLWNPEDVLATMNGAFAFQRPGNAAADVTKASSNKAVQNKLKAVTSEPVPTSDFDGAAEMHTMDGMMSDANTYNMESALTSYASSYPLDIIVELLAEIRDSNATIADKEFATSQDTTNTTNNSNTQVVNNGNTGSNGATNVFNHSTTGLSSNTIISSTGQSSITTGNKTYISDHAQRLGKAAV